MAAFIIVEVPSAPQTNQPPVTGRVFNVDAASQSAAVDMVAQFIKPSSVLTVYSAPIGSFTTYSITPNFSWTTAQA